MCSVIRETCEVLWDVLAKDFVKAPSNVFEWQQISQDFFLKWNFPNCIGELLHSYKLTVIIGVSKRAPYLMLSI